MTEPEISIGIVSAQEVNFSLNGNYLAKGNIWSGAQTLRFQEGGILWHNNLYCELTFLPQSSGYSFSLHNVTIGINFHWEHKETQIFSGALKFIVEEEKITAINILPAEDYLISVISSEMKATSPLEFLKAHAVISRSWLFAQINKGREKEENSLRTLYKTKTEYIRWYNREEHTNFDFCADDHCQRYQGITKAATSNVVEAVKETRGLLLMNGKEICDARFSKCCGGMTESFSTCWEDIQYPYLCAILDRKQMKDETSASPPDLTREEEAEKWIRSTPPSFCNVHNTPILSTILNSYDTQTVDFYRWSVSYTQQELSELIKKNTRSDFGFIIDLIPVQRGPSGRIMKLKIVGSLQTLTVGKELEIRRILSSTHLYSSAFVIDKGELSNGFPCRFTLHGAGWGHGVGLCQIGAAVMGEEGYTYEEILKHYYKGADIRKFY